MRCVLVSCCGLPAAGKTTFCRRIASDDPVTMPAASWTPTAVPPAPGAQAEELDANREGDTWIRVSHVCFDEYINCARRRRWPSSSENDSPSGTRTNLDPALGTGDESVETNRATEIAPRGGLAAGSEDSARLWHEGRRAALVEVEALASTQNTTDSSTVALPLVASEAEASHSSTERRESCLSPEAPAVHVVLVDDNMHFRTMRHEVLSLARKCACVDPSPVLLLASRDRLQPLLYPPVSSRKRARVASILSLLHCLKLNVMLLHDSVVVVVVFSLSLSLAFLLRIDGCGYAQVFFPTDVEVAVERNETRRTPVAEAVRLNPRTTPRQLVHFYC